VSNYANFSLIEQGTLPTASLISKQVIPYQIHGDTSHSSRSVAHSAVMKGANLGFASVFIEIPAQRPSIYRDFGLMISCARSALSPSFPIRRGFGFSWFPLRFHSMTALPAPFAIRCGVGDDSILGRSWAACERS
jgi:hypothetical protein